MAKLPTVAIIGRPNTGKSTLFNRLVGRRKAIVSEIPGTTRDHVASLIQNEEFEYLLVDTGGMGGGTSDTDLEDDVHRQSLLALENADLILLTLNSQEELTSSDFAIIDMLRKSKRSHVPVLLVATKCDDPRTLDEKMPEYLGLGLSDRVVAISAVHKLGIDDLQDHISQTLSALHFPPFDEQKRLQESRELPQIAIIGRPNVGKSSLVNAFMSETQRKKSALLVSDIPGTTRDATDTIIRYHDSDYLFVDTAGIKRRKSTPGGIETFAYFRSIRALERSDIAVLILDAQEPVSRQDKRIAGLAVEEGKGLIVVVNKIDLLNKEEKEAVLQHVRYSLQFCKFAPILPCSATSREGLLALFDLIEMVQRNRTRRIPTKDLQQWYKDTVYGQPMRALTSGKFITQAEEVPPTFVLFVRDPKKVQLSQLRYLDNQLRNVFGFEGTPIRWITKLG